MKTLQKLKTELTNNVEMTKLIDVFKGIAMSKFRLLERNKEKISQSLNMVKRFFSMISVVGSDHPFIRGKGRLGIMIITSDEGFMGGLNTRVINEALKLFEPKNTELIVIGEWGSRYLEALGYSFEKFPGVTKEKRNEEAIKYKDVIFNRCKSGKFSRLKIVYPKPISFTVQTPQAATILPVQEIFQHSSQAGVQDQDIIKEGATEDIIEYLLDLWLSEKLLEIFEDSNLSEYAARAVHLEQSHHLLKQKSNDIRLQYTRGRHELVDKGIREAFSSRVIRRKMEHGKS